MPPVIGTWKPPVIESCHFVVYHRKSRFSAKICLFWPKELISAEILTFLPKWSYFCISADIAFCRINCLCRICRRLSGRNILQKHYSVGHYCKCPSRGQSSGHENFSIIQTMELTAACTLSVPKNKCKRARHSHKAACTQTVTEGYLRPTEQTYPGLRCCGT